MTQKGFAKIFILYVIIGLIILGGAVYAVKNRTVIEPQPPVTSNEEVEPGSAVHDVENQDIISVDTSDWKVYKNEKYGFEIKYPNDWGVSGNSIMPVNMIDRCNNEDKPIEEQDQDNCVSLDVLEDAIGGEVSYYGTASGALIETKISTFPQEKYGNTEFYVLDNEFEAIGINSYFVPVGEDKYVGFRHSQRYDSNREVNERIINQILSTFKFTR